jgi:hypothetical protein
MIMEQRCRLQPAAWWCLANMPAMHASLLHILQVLVAVLETIWVVDDHGATDQPLPADCGGVAAMAV